MPNISMEWIPTEEEGLNLLGRHNVPQQVIEHSKAVTAFVKKISISHGVRRNVLIAGAILHSIGKSQTTSAKHAFIGGRILRDEGIDESVIRIVERHQGVGLTKKEAEIVGLPPRDFLPVTLEEKIVCYADKLVIGTYTATLHEAKVNFESKLPPNHPASSRWDQFMAEMKKTLGEPDKRFEADSRITKMRKEL